MISEEITRDIRGIVWEKPHFYLNGKKFIPKIHEINTVGDTASNSCNTIKINLDGRVSSTLDWNEADEKAQKYSEQGFQLFWNLDLGLFNRLKQPLSNQMQFLSLLLSIEHFQNTLWKKYQDQTLGICLYQGSTHFAEQLFWDEQLKNNYLTWGRKALGEQFEETHLFLKNLFARDAIAEYLTLIVNRFSDSMRFFIVLDNRPQLSLAMEAQLIHREKFDRIHIRITNNRLPTLSNYDDATIGLCLPCCNIVDLAFLNKLESILENLLNKKMVFRLVPEAMLINEWDGLDYLIVEPSCLSTQGRRKLQGFCAAGGTLVSLGDLLGLPNEISIHELFVYASLPYK